MLTSLEEPVTARSNLPSPLKSPAAKDLGREPAPKKIAAGPNVPSPLPCKTENVAARSAMQAARAQGWEALRRKAKPLQSELLSVLHCRPWRYLQFVLNLHLLQAFPRMSLIGAAVGISLVQRFCNAGSTRACGSPRGSAA